MCGSLTLFRTFLWALFEKHPRLSLNRWNTYDRRMVDLEQS